MATVREYFDTAVHALTVDRDWAFTTKAGDPVGTAKAKIAYDFEGNAKYWYIYIPQVPDLSAVLGTLFASELVSAGQLSAEGDGVSVSLGFADYSEKQDAGTLIFTHRVNLYVDYELTPENRATLVAEARAKGFFLTLRDREYARKRSEHEKPIAFISHDSRDKDVVVRELALELIKLHCPVWYDEYSLKVGDSLRDSIENGLKNASKCIVVLSPNYLSNSGWGKTEFNSIFTREIIQKENVVLPVWHNVDVNAVYEYSPSLADKVALPTSLGVPEVARRLATVIKGLS